MLAIAGAIVGVSYVIKPGQKKVDYKPALYQTQKLGQPVVLKDYVYYPGSDGKNAFELLQKLTPVQTKKFNFGVMVTSINDQTPDKDHFWKLYYNSQEAQVGSDQLVTHDGDAVEWVIEKINK